MVRPLNLQFLPLFCRVEDVTSSSFPRGRWRGKEAGGKWVVGK
jgi:hypothetical protein